MLISSMTVSLDGYINDRTGDLGFSAPSDEKFRFHLEEVSALGGYLLGRRLHEAMVVWETDPSMRSTEEMRAFADVWAALPKTVFSRTLDRIEGSSRLATAPLADEIAAALDAAGDKDVSIGGAELTGAAIGLGLLDEVRLFRAPVVLGGGTPYLPPVPTAIELELVDTRTLDGGVVFERYRFVP